MVYSKIRTVLKRFNRSTTRNSSFEIDRFFPDIKREEWISNAVEISRVIKHIIEEDKLNIYAECWISINELPNVGRPPGKLSNRLISSIFYCVPEVHLSKTPIFHANFKEAVAISDSIGLNVLYAWDVDSYYRNQLYLRYLIIQMNPTNNT